MGSSAKRRKRSENRCWKPPFRTRRADQFGYALSRYSEDTGCYQSSFEGEQSVRGGKRRREKLQPKREQPECPRAGDFEEVSEGVLAI